MISYVMRWLRVVSEEWAIEAISLTGVDKDA